MAVKADDFFGVVGEEEVFGEPGEGAVGADHRFYLAAEIVPESVAEKYERDAGTEAEFQVVEFDSDFFESADSAGGEDAEIGDVEPLLPIVAAVFLKRVEEIDAGSGRRRFQFEEAGSGEAVLFLGGGGCWGHLSGSVAGEEG